MTAEKLQIIIDLLKQGDGATKASSDLKTLDSNAKTADKSLQGIGASLGKLAAGVGLSLVIREIIQTSASAESLRTVLNNVTGSSTKTDAELKFLKDSANRLGAEFQRLAPAYAGIASAAKGTSLEGEQTREIFLGIASAAAANGRSAAEMEGALLAVQQMMSKGVVSAEELRGQLGERIPGAFELAAKSIGMTTQEFSKALEAGKIYAEDFLPKFASALIQRFGEAANNGAKTLTGQLNILKNNLYDLQVAAGEQGLAGGFKALVGSANSVLSALKENELAIIAIATASKTAAGAIALLGVQMVALRGYAATTALFGAAWFKTGKDAAAAASLIASSTASMAATIATAVTGAVAVVYTLVKAFQLLQAESEAAKSAQNLLEFNKESRERLEIEIGQRQANGAIDARRAAELRRQLAEGFAPKTHEITVGATATDAGEASIKVSKPDLKAQYEALKGVRGSLFPEMHATSGGADAAAKQKTLSDEQKKAASELAKLRQDMELQAVQGLERERIQARQNFEKRVQEIEEISRQSVASADEIAQLKGQAEVIFNNEMIRISEKRADQEKRHAQEVQQFRDDQTLATLSGYEREMKAAEINFESRRQQIAELAAQGMSAAEETALNELNLAVRVSEEKAAARQREEENYRVASEQMQALEQALAREAQFSSLNRVQQAREEFAQRIVLYDQLFRKGLMTEEQLRQATENAMQQRVDSMRMVGLDVQSEYERLTLSEYELAARNFERRKQLVSDYYDYEIQRARGNAEQQRQIEQQKTQHLEQLNQQKAQSTGQAAMVMGRLMGEAIAMSTQRIAHQLIYLDQSWGDFAANLLKSIAEMILQMLLFMAIQFALDSMGIGWVTRIGGAAASGAGALAGQGGSAPAGTALAARGGLFGSPVMAANGVIMAAGGVPGVGEVSRATFFPRFNVVAGEAGREMLTVLAQPRHVNFNGIPAVMGKAGDRHLAILDAASIGASRPMADGGFAGAQAPGSFGVGMSGGRGIGGEININVNMSPNLRAEIINDSVEGAVVRVTQEMQQEGRLSTATMRLVR